jgi:hypothetical protein
MFSSVGKPGNIALETFGCALITRRAIWRGFVLEICGQNGERFRKQNEKISVGHEA